MTTRELIEHASLDALGLLDESERAAFEAAFQGASPEVQALVRREQKRFADAEALLPDVAPPPGLKYKVLAAMREAIAGISAPVPEDAGVLARIGGSSWWNSASLWRAACIGFATASVVLGGFFLFVTDQNARMLVTLDQFDAYNELAPRGSGVERFVHDPFRVSYYAFESRDDLVLAQATLHVHEDGHAKLYLSGLPVLDGVYSLVAERGDEPARLITEFLAAGTSVQEVSFRVDGEVPDLAILGPLEENGGDERLLFLEVETL